MTKRDYTQEFKEQILRECQEVGNVAVVARSVEVVYDNLMGGFCALARRDRLQAHGKGEEPGDSRRPPEVDQREHGSAH